MTLAVHGGALVITPARLGVDRERLDKVADKMLDRYDDTFRKLAE